MKLIRILTISVSLLLSGLVSAEDNAIAELYQQHGIEGALVIASLDGSIEYIHNNKRAQRSYLPASTFKIPNTLIALEQGLIAEHDIIKWDGSDRAWPAWNKDQTLSSAFSASCIMCLVLSRVCRQAK